MSEPQQRPNAHACLTRTLVCFLSDCWEPVPRHGLVYLHITSLRGDVELRKRQQFGPKTPCAVPNRPNTHACLSHSGAHTAGSLLPRFMSLTRGCPLEPPLPRPEEAGAVVSLPLLGPASSSTPALLGPVLASTVSDMVVCRDSMLRAGKGTCMHSEQQHRSAPWGLTCWESKGA